MTYKTIDNLDNLAPSDLHLPDKFTSFRPGQVEAANFILHGDPSRAEGVRRFRCLGAPTGFGKTLLPPLIHALTQEKVAILTITRSLEDQVVGDGFSGLVNVRGRANYQCLDFHPHTPGTRWQCSDGDENGCRFYAGPACRYMNQVESARRSRLVLTNYQYWMHARATSRYALEYPQKDPVKWLFIDEAHLAPGALCNFLSTWISQADLQQYGGAEAVRLFRSAHKNHRRWDWMDSSWQRLAGLVVTNASARLEDLSAQSGSIREARQDPEFQRAERIVRDLSRVSRHAADTSNGKPNWIWRATVNEATGRAGLAFDCLWPHRYAEQYLFQGIPNVVLVSATLRPKLMSLLGIARKDYEFREWPKQFKKSKAPVYYYPVAKMGKGKDGLQAEASLAKGVEALDAWLSAGRLDRRTMVQTASYPRAQQVQMLSRYGRYMILNKDAGEASAKAEQFKKAKPPAILVSPSYSTGWDFAGSACEFNVILKLPFSDRSDPVVEARAEVDDEYEIYNVAQSVVQGAGRGERHDKDQCETVIFDAAWQWVRWAGADYIPRWFSTQKVGEIPPAPARIGV